MRSWLPIVGIWLLSRGTGIANPITLSGTGIVEGGTIGCEFCPPDFSGIATGDPFAFRFTFNGVTPLPVDDPNFGAARFGATDLWLTFDTDLGTKTIVRSVIGSGILVNNDVDAAVDQITVDATFPPWDFKIVAADPLGVWLTSTAVPTDLAAVLNAAPRGPILLIEFDTENGLAAAPSGRILTLTQTSSAVTTPEPTSLVLFASGLWAAALHRRHQRNRRRH